MVFLLSEDSPYKMKVLGSAGWLYSILVAHRPQKLIETTRVPGYCQRQRWRQIVIVTGLIGWLHYKPPRRRGWPITPRLRKPFGFLVPSCVLSRYFLSIIKYSTIHTWYVAVHIPNFMRERHEISSVQNKVLQLCEQGFHVRLVL